MESQHYLLFILLIIIAIKFFTNKDRKQKEYLLSLINPTKGLLLEANKKFEDLTNLNTGYCTTNAMLGWKNRYNDLFQKLHNHDFSKIKLEVQFKNQIKAFLDRHVSAEELRNQYNKKFIDQELVNYASFFDDVEGRKLDQQQRLAIITDEDHQLVVAGAGSGKTTTIVGKIKYILNRYHVPPESILAISFTSKSAQTLSERIDIPGIEVKTFHKLGKDIIQSSSGIKPSIFDEAQFDGLIANLIKEKSLDFKYLNKLTTYFVKHLKIDKSQFEFEDQGAYIQFLKDQNFRSLKLKEFNFNGKKTYKQEIVKSSEECKIANFLYLNGVEYEYEKPYEYPTANEEYGQYKPDFTIFQGDKRIYLEHWGIDKEGNVPKWFVGNDGKSAKEVYQQNKEWKLDLHNHHQTKLLESTSHQIQGDEDLTYLKIQLIEAGVELKPKNDEQIWEVINSNTKEDVKIFTRLVCTTITLLKSNNYSISDLRKKNRELSNKKLQRRNEKFIELVEPIFNGYQDYISQRNEIDFSDMINLATSLIGQSTRKYKYIIIDEFQDISIGRYKLIKAIFDKSNGCRLFCVGDDWQSIYRFSGSDLSIFSDFEKYFGKTLLSKIETTYRFNEPVISMSSSFILKNPSQVSKKLRSFDKSRQTHFSIVYSKNPELDYSHDLIEIFQKLLSQNEIEEKEILILGRYKRDLEQIGNFDSQLKTNIKTQEIQFQGTNPKGKPVKLNAKFLTIHKSKGLEGDIVILLNCNAGKYGFPAEMTDDPVLNLLLSNADQYENGEERRLFYVALTRAKEHTYLVTSPFNKSKFVVEIEESSPFNTISEKSCPRCKNTFLMVKKSGIAKNGVPYRFYGCLNFDYGCSFTEMVFENKRKTEPIEK